MKNLCLFKTEQSLMTEKADKHSRSNFFPILLIDSLAVSVRSCALGPRMDCQTQTVHTSNCIGIWVAVRYHGNKKLSNSSHIYLTSKINASNNYPVFGCFTVALYEHQILLSRHFWRHCYLK